jgi:hypothetical protein
MHFWALTYNPPLAVVIVWASELEEARRLSLEHLADRVPGVEPTETGTRRLEEAPTGYVALSSVTDTFG